MILLLARQSVMIKCNLKKSILLGNYEYYYAAGLLTKLQKITVDADIKPADLEQLVKEKLPEYEPEDEREQHLKHMLSEYVMEEGYDEQMKELFLMGQNEAMLWQN